MKPLNVDEAARHSRAEAGLTENTHGALNYEAGFAAGWNACSAPPVDENLSDYEINVAQFLKKKPFESLNEKGKELVTRFNKHLDESEFDDAKVLQAGINWRLQDCRFSGDVLEIAACFKAGARWMFNELRKGAR